MKNFNIIEYSNWFSVPSSFDDKKVVKQKNWKKNKKQQTTNNKSDNRAVDRCTWKKK